MIDTRIVGAYISQLRRDADMTQAEMAGRLNVTHQAVSKWENGLALPDVQILMDLANLFGVSIEQILSGGGRPGNRTATIPEPAREFTPGQTVQPDKQESAETELHDGEPVELNLDLLSQLAPFMGREAVDRLFEKACTGQVSPDCLTELAPFVSREKLERAVDMIGDGQLSATHLAGLAPFLGRDAVRKALGKIQDGTLDRSALVGLAPFLGTDLVEALILGKVKVEQVRDESD